MLLGEHRTPIEFLITRRHIERRVLVEKVDGLQLHLDDLARHDGEILDACHVLQAKLHPHDDILVHNGLLAIRPRAHAGAAARLIRVLAAGVEFAVMVFRDIDIVVGEFRAFMVERVGVGEHFLKAWGVDFIADGFAVDGVAGGFVEDFEGAGGVIICIQAGGLWHGGLQDGVANTVGVEIGYGHGVGFVVDEAVGVAVNCWVDAEREDVLMVDGEDARVNDGSPRYFDTFVDRLSTEDAGRSDLVG